MKKKRFLIILAISIIVIAGSIGAVLKVMANEASYIEQNNGDSPIPTEVGAVSPTREPSLTISPLGIYSSSSESEVVHVMHLMTHQKVESSEKLGAALMTEGSIDEVYGIVKDSDFVDKDQLTAMITRWKNSDFSQIVSDHNYLWQLEGGEIGKATRIYSSAEEQQFISKYFSDRPMTGERITE